MPLFALQSSYLISFWYILQNFLSGLVSNSSTCEMEVRDHAFKGTFRYFQVQANLGNMRYHLKNKNKTIPKQIKPNFSNSWRIDQCWMLHSFVEASLRILTISVEPVSLQNQSRMLCCIQIQGFGFSQILLTQPKISFEPFSLKDYLHQSSEPFSLKDYLNQSFPTRICFQN